MCLSYTFNSTRDVYEFNYMSDYLADAQIRFIIMHFFCAVAIIISKIVSAQNRNSYIQNFLMMITVPLYQVSIFKAFYDVTMTDNLGQELQCTGISFSLRRSWVQLEICAFVVNIVQLSLSMVKQLKPCGGGTCCAEKIEDILDETYEDEMEETIREVEAVVQWIRMDGRLEQHEEAVN